MQLHNTYINAPDDAHGAVLAIGNFDGLHKGHQALLRAAREMAAADKAPFAAMTFEPHPREFFQTEAPPFRLTLPSMKQRLLQDCGVEHLFALPFNKELSQVHAADFISDILVRHLKIRRVVVGDGFAFGSKKSGSAAMLASDARFATTALKPVTDSDGVVISSSRVREHLQKAEFAAAEKLLGRAWDMEDIVVDGDKRGRTIGYPTANQNVARYIALSFGVYAVRVKIEDENLWRGGVANFGIRPMFKSARPLLETYIFDFQKEIYGKNMRVQPVQKLRGELNFANIEMLKAKIEQDCLAAKAVLKSAAI